MDPDPFPRPFRTTISTLNNQARSHSAWPPYESAVAAAPFDRAVLQPEEPANAPAAPQPINPSHPANDRIFPCTFCNSTFKTKHDWQRHERSLHLSLEEWTCSPGDGLTTSPATGTRHCAYCSEAEPTPQHLDDAHNHQACHSTSSSGSPPRTFRRKDHLIQHLRLVHRVDREKLVALDADPRWRTNAAPAVASRCGFCGCQLQGWQTRVDHLALHFRAGLTMQDWQGDYGFSPSVAAQVRNAMF